MRSALLSLMIWVVIILLTILVWLASLISVVLFGLWDPDRRIAHQTIKGWAHAVVKLNPYWKLAIDDRAHLKPHHAYVFVANHQSLADVVVLPHIGLPYKCLSKAELFGIPFLGWALGLNQHIPLRRGSIHSTHQAMTTAKNWISRRMPVVFFAEGTRSRTGELTPFKPGAFQLAIRTGTPVVPLAITGTRDALPRGSWKFQHQVCGKLTILPPIDTTNYTIAECDHLRQRAFDAVAQVFYTERRASDDAAHSLQ